MNVLDHIATSLNRRDETPNRELAEKITHANDVRATQDLVACLSHQNKSIQGDCIKVLYEIGERNPNLIAGYYREFGKLLESRNNRLVWGAMTALDSIALTEPNGVYKLIPKIIAIADSGSVITRDHAMGIFTKLGTLKRYADKCLLLVIEQLSKCPSNQFPMYAEMSVQIVNDKNRNALQSVVRQRLEGLEKESQTKRVAKVLNRLAK